MAFENGKIYKISCIADETVLDLSDGSTANAADIITWSFNGGENQLWLATKADAGWELSSLVQAEPELAVQCADEKAENADSPEIETTNPSASSVKTTEKKCLDQDLKKGRLLHYTRKEGFNFNQQWFTKEVTVGASIYTINNVSSGKSITSHGLGEKVTCEKEGRKSSKQHWVITPVEK